MLYVSVCLLLNVCFAALPSLLRLPERRIKRAKEAQKAYKSTKNPEPQRRKHEELCGQKELKTCQKLSLFMCEQYEICTY